MLTLQLLGRISLRDRDGRELDELLRQSKRLALLAFLACPAPGTWHRRDTLIGCFWPEADAARARTSLRNALYVLRGVLGDGVLRTRGDEDVSLDPERIRCDAALFLARAQSGDHAAGLAEYGGDFLPGLFISGSEGFERWLEDQRRLLRAEAVRVAAALRAERELEGDLPGAIAAARRGLVIDPADEPALRHLVRLLDRTGDRAGAMAAFEEFRDRLRTDFEASPAPETIALVEAVRGRQGAREPTAPVPDPATLAGAHEPAAPLSGRADAARPARRRGRWAMAGALAVAVTSAAWLAARRVEPAPGGEPPQVVILRTTNGAGTAELDVLSFGVSSSLVERLRGNPLLRVADGSDLPPEATAAEIWLDPLDGTRARRLLLRSQLGAQGADSLQLIASLQTWPDSQPVWAETVIIGRDQLPDAIGRLAAGVVGGALGPGGDPMVPSRGQTNAQSWQLMVKGRYHLIGQGSTGAASRRPIEAARDAFEAAVAADPSNAGAWAAMSSIYASAAVTGRGRAFEDWSRAEGAARRALELDTAQAGAAANLGLIRAIRDGDVPAGERAIRRAIATSPRDPELWGPILGTVLRLDGRLEASLEAVRVAQRLDPLSGYSVGREAFLLLCLGRYAEAQARYEAVLRFDPRATGSMRGQARALAALGRWPEAMGALRRAATLEADSVTLAALDRAPPDSAGYAGVQRLAGARLVKQLAASGSLGRLGLAHLQAGNVEQGMALLEADARAGGVTVYQLRCHEARDAHRDDPRVTALVERYGHLGRREAQPGPAVLPGGGMGGSR